MQKNIGVVGLYHLGCVITACWARSGYQVCGFDYNASMIGDLRKGKLPIFEPGLEELFKEQLRDNIISFTDNLEDLRNCPIVFLAFDTPINDDDSSDVRPLVKTINDLSEILTDNSVVIVSSQTPVGLCRELRAILKRINSSLELVYSPENLRLGEAIHCYLRPERVILGVESDGAHNQVKTLFNTITPNVITMSLESAEMVKHGINTFLATSIVFGNTLSDLCEVTGADASEVIAGIKSDERIGPRAYLEPGPGFSGGTLARDLRILERLELGQHSQARFFGLIYQINKERTTMLVDKIERVLETLRDKIVGVLGLTYKAGTSTLRRNLALDMVNELTSRGAEVRAFDPKAELENLLEAPKFKIVNSVEELADNADILVLLTNWPEFNLLPWPKIRERMRRPVFFDMKNFLSPEVMLGAGYTYLRLGQKYEPT